MAEVTITNPEVHDTKKVDDRGRVYVGKELVGETVRVTVEKVDDGE